jgi:hypothetical protein
MVNRAGRGSRRRSDHNQSRREHRRRVSATPDAPELSLGCTSTQLSNSGVSPQLIRSREAGLLWARSRIRHLDAKKDGKGALAIAKEFNTLSRDAAFIA